MYVSLETLRRAVGLVDSLADLDDPAGFTGVVLPGLAALVGCDVRAIPVEHQIAVNLPGPGQQVIGLALSRARGDFSGQDRALLGVLRGPLSSALVRARRRQHARQVLTATSGGGLADLTRREIQILRLVADGRTNAAIAHALEVSPRTIAKHLEHIYRKLGVSSRAAAVARLTTPAGPVRPAPAEQ